MLEAIGAGRGYLRWTKSAADLMENAIAACSNCHRRLHYSVDRMDYRRQVIGSVARLRSLL